MYHHKPSVTRVLTWSSVDALTTQTAILLYEYVLSYTMGSEFHGMFGHAISILYIAEGVATFGFDSNIAAFSQEVIANRWNFFKFALGGWLPHLIWMSGVTYYMYYHGLPGLLEQNLYAAFFPWVLIFIIEAIRKTGKHLLRFIGYIREAAIVEIIGTLSYVTLSGIALAYSIASLSLLLYIHAITSLGQMIYILWHISTFAKQLPSASQQNAPFSIIWMHIHRLFVGVNEVAGTLYTGNFLIPLFAYSRGYAFASVFRLASATARWLVQYIQQIFVTTGSITLAQHKLRPIEERQRIFHMLTHYLHQIVYAVVFFVIINSRWLFVPEATISFTPLQAICIGFLLFALTLVDSFCAFYLRWYIVEEQAYSIALFNLASIAGMQAIVQLQDLDDLLIIIAMFAVRTLAFIMISAWSAYVWNIKPSLKWEKESIVVTIVISILWFVTHLW